MEAFEYERVERTEMTDSLFPELALGGDALSLPLPWLL
jgi:hypothetical protein